MLLFVWTKFFRILWIYFSIYLLVYNYLLSFLQPFFNTWFTFASFRNDVKSPLLIETLIDRWTKSENVSDSSLIILVGTSVSSQGLKAPKQTKNLLKNFVFLHA